jgi:hypothetical protein
VPLYYIKVHFYVITCLSPNRDTEILSSKATCFFPKTVITHGIQIELRHRGLLVPSSEKGGKEKLSRKNKWKPLWRKFFSKAYGSSLQPDILKVLRFISLFLIYNSGSIHLTIKPIDAGFVQQDLHIYFLSYRQGRSYIIARGCRWTHRKMQKQS